MPVRRSVQSASGATIDENRASASVMMLAYSPYDGRISSWPGSTGHERRDADEDQRRHERDHEGDSGQHLVPEAPVQAEDALQRVPPDRDERPDRGTAGAVVRPVADVVDARALVAHALASM